MPTASLRGHEVVALGSRRVTVSTDLPVFSDRILFMRFLMISQALQVDRHISDLTLRAGGAAGGS